MKCFCPNITCFLQPASPPLPPPRTPMTYTVISSHFLITSWSFLTASQRLLGWLAASWWLFSRLDNSWGKTSKKFSSIAEKGFVVMRRRMVKNRKKLTSWQLGISSWRLLKVREKIFINLGYIAEKGFVIMRIMRTSRGGTRVFAGGGGGAPTHFSSDLEKKLCQNCHNNGEWVLSSTYMTDYWADKQKKKKSENPRGQLPPPPPPPPHGAAPAYKRKMNWRNLVKYHVGKSWSPWRHRPVYSEYIIRARFFCDTPPLFIYFRIFYYLVPAQTSWFTGSHQYTGNQLTSNLIVLKCRLCRVNVRCLKDILHFGS